MLIADELTDKASLGSYCVFKIKTRFHLAKSFIAIPLLEKKFLELCFIRNVIDRKNGFVDVHDL